MISSKLVNSLIKKNLFQTIARVNYVKDRQLDIVRAKYDPQKSKWQKAKMYTHIFKHIAFAGFKNFKNDLKSYFKLRFKKQQLTHEQKIQLSRMRYDIVKTGPLIFIDILPFSGPLFLLYMYTYPQSIPSWFIIDTYYNAGVIQRREAQQNAIKYFQQKGINKDNIDLSKFTLQDTRKLSQLLFGYYRDGTKGINKVFNKQIKYFLSSSFSKWMIIKKIKTKFKLDSVYQHIHSQMTFQEKIKWKWIEVVQFQNYHVGQLIDIQAQRKKQLQQKVPKQKEQMREQTKSQNTK